MEIHAYPRSFWVQPGKVATAQGEMDVMRVGVLDIGGTVVHLVFGMEDWAAFQRAVADWEAAAAAAQARARIVGPGGLAPTLRERKH